jgi:TPP-dependent pyruvate/acetoin dehydrogenase alpha subunit
MNVDLTAADLIAFEEEVCELFADKKILAPIHLDNGNEEQLIRIFKDYVNEKDWICGSWRQHYKALLKGVPREDLMQAILDGKSISLCFPKQRVISSAIVGGILPIGVGLAIGLKSSLSKSKVVCFVGDMTAETGIFHECLKYSTNHQLPILFVIEDNGKSVCTPTRKVWNQQILTYEPLNYVVAHNLLYYKYESRFPHAGGLTRVQF